MKFCSTMLIVKLLFRAKIARRQRRCDAGGRHGRGRSTEFDGIRDSVRSRNNDVDHKNDFQSRNDSKQIRYFGNHQSLRG
jgi:hypothetical protein